jgi:cytochrome P450
MTVAAEADAAPRLAMPPRPARPLSSLRLIKVALRNSVAACDEELFDELIVERRFLWYRSVIVSDPAGIRRVLLDNADNYRRIPQMAQILGPALGEGLLTSAGETWSRHRRLMMPLMDHRSVLADAPIVAAAAVELADTLAAAPPGKPLNISDHIARLLICTIARIFGDQQFEALLTAFLANPRSRRLLDFVRAPAWLGRTYGSDTLRRTARSYDGLLLELIAERRRRNYRGNRDLLWRLANVRERASGAALSDAEVRDEAMTLAFGAIDTTVRGLTWLWYLLGMHPWAEARVQDELETVLRGRVPTAEGLPKLVYLRKVIDETLRLYPPIPVMLRTAAAEDEICGRRIRRNAIVTVAPWIVHRHRRLWTHPDAFDPERFDLKNVAARQRSAYIPFALGPHVCIGASLAMIEMMLIAAVLAQRFRFRLVPTREVRPVGGFLTLRAAGGLWMTVERREVSRSAAKLKAASRR